MTLEWGVAPPKQHVIIIGAGFGGLACARKLRKSRTYRVTLID
ncbi:MAG: NAD(P)-binding protein, partial [Ilumatobacteraceae bacterium]